MPRRFIPSDFYNPVTFHWTVTRILFALCTAFVAFFLSVSVVLAQDEPFNPDAAPPPIKRMSKDEQKRLNDADGPKSRVNTAVDLMELRLRYAENEAAAAQYDVMFNHLGAFQAIMDDTIDYLYQALNRREKVFDSFKRFEIKLRGFATRLALIRREVPPAYDPYVRDLLKHLREARSKAVDPLFGELPSAYFPRRR
jgi:hypothetical protein